MFEQPDELRKLAEWYRVWAELGNDADRAWRRSLVAFLEKRASEIEVLPPPFCPATRRTATRRAGEEPKSGFRDTSPAPREAG